VGAALSIRSFDRLLQIHSGFNPAGVYNLHLSIPRSRHPEDRDVAALGDRILERVRTMPEVSSAGLVDRLPLAGATQTVRSNLKVLIQARTSIFRLRRHRRAVRRSTARRSIGFERCLGY
jgi:hypothetical protein